MKMFRLVLAGLGALLFCLSALSHSLAPLRSGRN